MQDLIKNIGRFFERHVEKIVLVVIGIVCAVLFFKFVIFSPHQVAVGNKKVSPPLSSIREDPVIMPPTRGAIAGIRKYRRPPRIGEVTDVAVGHLRAAAWVPVETLTADLGYDKVEVEANDIDLVTVEAKFDVAHVYRLWRSHFAGEEVPRPEWRDPCLAEPVFGAVQLQRRQQVGNDLWGDWQEGPRRRAETDS